MSSERWGKAQTDQLNELIKKRKVIVGVTTADSILQSNDPEVAAATNIFKKLKNPRPSLTNQLKNETSRNRITEYKSKFILARN